MSIRQEHDLEQGNFRQAIQQQYYINRKTNAYKNTIEKSKNSALYRANNLLVLAWSPPDTISMGLSMTSLNTERN